MTIKKFRTCNRCKARFRGGCDHLDVCILGYKLKYRKGVYDLSIGYPGEPCPKPQTDMEFADAPRKSFHKEDDR